MTSASLAGILNIDKPGGMTSHDVVSRVRKILKLRKVGHAGTLDPMATGVLLVCVGQATRLIEYLMPGEKCYQAKIQFGKVTNTYDAEGEVVATSDPAGLTEKMVSHTLQEFTGTLSQTPPPFSAIKKNGVPLYKLARQGVIVTPEPRSVKITAIELIAWQPPEVVINVRCQAGTYIRSLAHDVGRRLKVGAHLTGLTRLASGQWYVAEAISLDQLQQAVDRDILETVLHPMEDALSDIKQIYLSVEQAKAVRYGQTIPWSSQITESLVAGLDADDRLVAILELDEAGQLNPKKVFN